MVDQGVLPKEKGIDMPMVKTANKGKVLKRTKEEILTVWVAPFEDEEGIYHEPGVLRAVVSPARWELSKA
ncbi:MAG: TraV family lipoprotein [Gammaproteobacteria bacterium]|nr:TraV family lipoprotein [Gammaproteobacteria bacterium]